MRPRTGEVTSASSRQSRDRPADRVRQGWPPDVSRPVARRRHAGATSGVRYFLTQQHDPRDVITNRAARHSRLARTRCTMESTRCALPTALGYARDLDNSQGRSHPRRPRSVAGRRRTVPLCPLRSPLDAASPLRTKRRIRPPRRMVWRAATALPRAGGQGPTSRDRRIAHGSRRRSRSSSPS